MLLNLPVTIQGYKFLRLIGRGGFSDVYLVQSERFRIDLCAKVSQFTTEGSDDERKTVENEIDALTTLSHPHIVRLYDHFHDGRRFYLILELCRGGSLQSELARTRGLSLHRFRVAGRQVLSALAYCHLRGIAHHDIKLGNVLLDEFGRCKLADFGISVRMTTPGALTDQYAGSVQYEAPELFTRRPHDPFRSDIWALGVLFAHMVTGRSPWTADTVGKLAQQIPAGSYKLKRNTPPEVADVISKMIVVDPAERITCRELLKNPLFRHTEEMPVDGILDCLSPLGRRHMVNVGVPMDSADQQSDHSERGSQSAAPVQLTVENSTTLMLVNRNLQHGFLPRPEPAARYHSSARVVPCLSAISMELVRLSDDSTNSPNRG
jgi:serine/threonine protein kinase